MKWELLKTPEFEKWCQGLSQHELRMVNARLLRIQVEGHFGTVHRFDGLTELKWKSGLRVYTVERKPDLIVLLGGNKNGQGKDIRRAKKILSEVDET